MLDMPIDQKSKHDQNEEHLDKQQRIGLSPVIVLLNYQFLITYMSWAIYFYAGFFFLNYIFINNDDGIKFYLIYSMNLGIDFGG